MNRSFGGSFNCNSANYNKGKSFRFSEWNLNSLYSNDDYIQDFVSYMGSMYACIQTNTAVTPTNQLYWKLVVSGQPGIQGEQGSTGVTFTPHIDVDGNLSWTNDGGLDNPQTVNIKGPKGADSTVPGPKGDKGETGVGLIGPQGKTGETGIGLDFNWEGTKLGIKRTVDDEYTYVDLKGSTGTRGLKGNTGSIGPEGPKGPKGDSLYIQVSEPNEFGQRFLQKRYSESEAWVSFFDLSEMRGPKGDSIIVERNLETGNIEYRYQNQPSSSNKILIYKDDIKGPKGDTIAKTYVADDGYLYIQLSGENVPRRVGYVRGDRGLDGREIVLRVYSGPSEDPNDERIGTHLQWKYAGDEYKLWTNLIQINDLMNVALSGLKLEYSTITEESTKYEVIELNSYQVKFNENNDLVLTKKIANLSSIKVPTKTFLKNVELVSDTNKLVFTFDTATGDKEIEIDCSKFDDTKTIEQLRKDLDSEITTRTESDTQLQKNIDAENVRATKAETEIKTNLEEEIKRSTDVDNTVNESLVRMYPKVFPLSVVVSGGGTFKRGTSQNITVKWTTKESTDVITPKTVKLNKEVLGNTITSKVFNGVTTNTTYTVTVSNDYQEVSGSTSVRFVNPNYFGVVDASSKVTSEMITKFSELILGTKSYSGTATLNNQRTVYAYPKSFGALTSIKDSNNFDYINSYTRSELEINGELYYVYVLTSPTSITTFKQNYA